MLLNERNLLQEHTIPGRCVLEQPGVNAPGTPKITCLPVLHSSAMFLKIRNDMFVINDFLFN